MILARYGLERKFNRERCQFQASSFLLNIRSLDRMGGKCQLEHMDKPLYPNWEDDGCTALSPRQFARSPAKKAPESFPSPPSTTHNH
jgi:hypothetical protein